MITPLDPVPPVLSPDQQLLDTLQVRGAQPLGDASGLPGVSATRYTWSSDRGRELRRLTRHVPLVPPGWIETGWILDHPLGPSAALTVQIPRVQKHSRGASARWAAYSAATNDSVRFDLMRGHLPNGGTRRGPGLPSSLGPEGRGPGPGPPGAAW